MISDLASGCDVYLFTGYTDMRKGIDGLATVVQGKLSLDPFSWSLYLFCGRNRIKIKGLLWEGDGYICFEQQFGVYCFAEELILLGFLGFFWCLFGVYSSEKRCFFV